MPEIADSSPKAMHLTSSLGSLVSSLGPLLGSLL
jgi:hypothetical protein